MVYTQWLWIFIASALIQCMLIVLAFPRRNTVQGKAFLLVLGCMILWTTGFICESASIDLSAKIACAKIQYIGIALLPVAWFFLAQTFVGKQMAPGKWIAALIIPCTTIVLATVVPMPNAFWGSPGLVLDQAPFAVVDYDYGFWFYLIHAPYGYVLTAAALARLVLAYRGCKPLFRKQLVTLIIAFIIPAATDILYVGGLSFIRNYNFTTAVCGISGLLLFQALFRYHLLDIVPMALHLVLDSMQDGLVLLDPQVRMIEMNPSMCSLAGIPAATMAQHTGKPLSDIMDARLAEAMTKAIHTRQVQTLQLDTLRLRKPDANPAWQSRDKRVCEIEAVDVLNKQGIAIGIMATVHDITERQEMMARLEHLASHDDLTGIYNRREILRIGGRLLAASQGDSPLSVCMMDIDSFKTINDTLGHEAGDQTLVTCAIHCTSVLRDGQVMGRMGGDEFLLLMPDATLDEAMQSMMRLHASLGSVVVPGLPQDNKVSFSMGVASTDQFPEPPSMNDLLAHADKALYKAKLSGKNRVARAQTDAQPHGTDTSPPNHPEILANSASGD